MKAFQKIVIFKNICYSSESLGMFVISWLVLEKMEKYLLLLKIMKIVREIKFN
jgi:hypothetical protein